MSRRSLGLALCVLGFLAVCLLAVISTAGRPFQGLAGIENQLEEQAGEILLANGVDGAIPSADGRTLNVELPGTVPASFDRQALQADLDKIEGLRGTADLVGTPTIAAAATPAQEPEPTTEPTAVPATAVPQAEPTATPVPAPTDAPEPEPDPTSAPTLSEIVAPFARSPIDFEAGTAELTLQDGSVLDVIADELRGQTTGSIEVQAHTDNVGDPDANLLLSQDRAEAVTNYLIEQGVDSALLTPRGYGASQPVADNSTEQGRIDNRRVVFVVEGN